MSSIVSAAPRSAARTRATLVGGVAILLWSTLALLVTLAPLPPFQMTALTFGIAALLAVGKWIWTGEWPIRHLAQPPVVWLLGVAGLFGYHALYFLAFRLAPPVSVNLMNYSWPLLIVVFSAFLPGERLEPRHLVGAGAGLAGTALLLTGGELALGADALWGCIAAGTAALLWAVYSVLSRALAAHVSTDAVGGFCAATSLLAALCHLAFESWVAPSPGMWAALLVLGIGPVGLAFFAWDYGVKRGDLRLLGVASYATPLLSTLLLILFGRGALTPVIAVSGLLIIGGAVIASRRWGGQPGG